MLFIVFWTLFLFGAAFSQEQSIQNEQSDVCLFQTQTWKETLEKYQEMYTSVVDKNSNRFQQMLSQEMEVLTKNLTTELKDRDQNLELKMTQNQKELQAFFVEKINRKEMINPKSQNLDKMEDKTLVNRVAILHLIHALKEQEEDLKKTNTGLEELKISIGQNLEKSAIVAREAISESSKNQENAFDVAKNAILKEMKDTYQQAALSFGTEIKRLTQMFGDKFAALKKDVEPIKCKFWNEKVSGLELKELETGVYHFGKTYITWKAAVDFCKSRGMHLVVIESEKEMNLISANKHGDSWVSASDIGRQPGQFYWTDGRPMDKTWTSLLDDYGAGKETCVFLSGKLRDYPCANTRYYICEVSADFEQCV